MMRVRMPALLSSVEPLKIALHQIDQGSLRITVRQCKPCIVLFINFRVWIANITAHGESKSRQET